MKVLIINPLIPDYRLPIFNMLGNEVDLTILHSGKFRQEKNLSFQQIILHIKKIGPFFIYPSNLHKICKQFDVIISEANIRYFDRNLLIMNPLRKYKWITWGIGVSASYDKKFDEDNKTDFIRHLIFKNANAQIFYSDYPLKKYIDAGFDANSLFVANNTTEVIFNENLKFVKHKLLFVGTLYKQKRIYELLESYLEFSKICLPIIPLHIIGDGSEFNMIKEWIVENDLSKYIVLHGSIFDQTILEKHFRESYACISPGQAGLSVLTSMGYGTPYITRKDSITGGEIFNIENGINGVLYNNDKDLVNVLKDISEAPGKYIKMGLNARAHYLKYRSPSQMVHAFIDACNYVY